MQKSPAHQSDCKLPIRRAVGLLCPRWAPASLREIDAAFQSFAEDRRIKEVEATIMHANSPLPRCSAHSRISAVPPAKCPINREGYSLHIATFSLLPCAGTVESDDCGLAMCSQSVPRRIMQDIAIRISHLDHASH